MNDEIKKIISQDETILCHNTKMGDIIHIESYHKFNLLRLHLVREKQTEGWLFTLHGITSAMNELGILNKEFLKEFDTVSPLQELIAVQQRELCEWQRSITKKETIG